MGLYLFAKHINLLFSSTFDVVVHHFKVKQKLLTISEIIDLAGVSEEAGNQRKLLPTFSGLTSHHCLLCLDFHSNDLKMFIRLPPTLLSSDSYFKSY